MGEMISWFRDGSPWNPSPEWQAIYDTIEAHASLPDHLYTETERVLRLQAMALADRITAALKEADRSGFSASRDHDHTAGVKLEGEQ